MAYHLQLYTRFVFKFTEGYYVGKNENDNCFVCFTIPARISFCS